MKTILLLLCLFVTAITNAQISKKAILLGGQFSLGGSSSNSNTTAEMKNNFQSINLSAGKAFRENQVTGLMVNYSHWRSSFPGYADTASTQNNSFAIGLFFRQYKKIANKFYFFGQTDASYSYGITNGKNNIAQISYQSKLSLVSLGLTPGISYQICKHIQAEITLPNVLQLYYHQSKSTKKEDPAFFIEDKAYGIRTSFSNVAALSQLGIGFSFIL